MKNIEIVKKLIGEIRPVGETHKDNERFENLKAMCELANDLVSEIDAVGNDFKNSHEFSVKRAADFANKFLVDQLGIN